MSEPTDAGATGPDATPGRRCPICRKPTVHRYRPFCSARCADIDLGRWFTEAYRVPGEPIDPTSAGEPLEPGPAPSDEEDDASTRPPSRGSRGP